MKPYYVALAALLALSSCGSGTNPFQDPTEEPDDGGDGGDGGDTGNPIEGDRDLPPGTSTPSPRAGIFRSEPTSTDPRYQGNGFAQDIRYNAEDDTFEVDNLAFDGANVYQRSTPFGNLGPYAVYEADSVFPDSFDGTPIGQMTHRAIYGVSNSGNSQFAIVRTGSYVGYGFGGFVYQRNEGVTLPTTGQAHFSGEMSGLRDYNGRGGLEYTRSDIEIIIDFEDFNDTTNTRGDAVRGRITNRRIYDLDGLEITDRVLNRINEANNINLTEVPTGIFAVGPGVLDDNGEMLGELNSYYVDANGDVQTFETGNYYAVMSGDAEEIVGVVVLENNLDPTAESVRETGGFVVYN